MKKRLIPLVMLISITVMAQNEKPFQLKGSLKNIALPVQKVYISYQSNGNNVLDSVNVTDGQYSFSGKLTEPLMARLRIKYNPDADGKPVKLVGGRDLVTLFLSPDHMEVSSVDSF